MASLSTLSAANVVTFELNQEYSGKPPATSVLPGLTATFSQAAGGVLLTMHTTNLVAGEFVSKWNFNLDPALNLSLLTFSYINGTNGQQANSITKKASCCKAAGEGTYDILFSFETSNKNSGAQRFTGGEFSRYLIGGIAGLTPDSFSFLSQPRGGNGIWHSSAHIQGIAKGKSSWIGGSPDTLNTIPEPTSVLLGGSVALVLGFGLWRRRRSSQGFRPR